MSNPSRCIECLACPVCGEVLGGAGTSAHCSKGHSFDFARSGYLNLTRGGGGGERVGDSPEMVRARAEFLAAGHYEPVARALAAAALEAGGDGAVVEVGSGTGYYLDSVLEALGGDGKSPGAIGVDLSKAAAERAAKLHPGACFVVADVEEGIPLVDRAASLVLSVFAPRPAAELGRVTRAGGALLVALAGPRHLGRLRERLDLMALGEDKLERLRERLEPWFEPTDTTPVEYELALSEGDARRLVLMGPNARHDPDLSPLAGGHEDLVSVVLAVFRRRLS